MKKESITSDSKISVAKMDGPPSTGVLLTKIHPALLLCGKGYMYSQEYNTVLVLVQCMSYYEIRECFQL